MREFLGRGNCRKWLDSVVSNRKAFARSEDLVLTLLVCVLIPIRVTRYVRRALLLLLAAALKHLLEELELGERERGEEGEEEKSQRAHDIKVVSRY